MSANDNRPHIKPTPAFLQRLPKTDLHVHLDGSMRLQTIIELAEQQGVELPANDPAGLAKAIQWFAGRQRRLGRVPESMSASMSEAA